MATAELRRRGERDQIFVATTYTEKDLISQVPGVSWDRDAHGWWAPLTWAACLQLRGVFGSHLTIGPELKAWAWEARHHVERLMSLREALRLEDGSSQVLKALDEVEREASLTLRPFQRAAVEYLATASRAGLFDDMGSGKSPTTIRTVQVLSLWEENPYPLLVVCPNSLKFTVWRRELARWAPELRVSVVDGSAGARRKTLAAEADVYVVNWDVLRLHSRLAPYGSARLTEAQRQPRELNHLGARTVILDEAHRLAGVGQKTERRDDGTQITVPASQQAQAALQLCRDAEFCFVLTGTPADNHVGDLWGLLNAIQQDWFPGRSKYLARYAQTSFGLFGGQEVIGLNPRTEPEFRAVTQPLYRRIPQEVLLPQLPAFRPVLYRDVTLTLKQLRAYREMEQAMLAQLDQGLLVAANAAGQFGRLLQFAAASAELVDRGPGEAPTMRLAAPSAKVDDLVELLAELGPDEPLVVGAESRQLVELAAARLAKERISHALITGAVAPIDREHAVRRFQEGQVRVILLTFGAGAEGITLTRARYLCYLQRSWRPMLNAQFRKRVQRIGAEGHDWLQEVEIRAVGTVEERKEAALDGKELRIEELLQDRETVRRLLGA